MDQVDADLDVSAPKSSEMIVLEVPRRPLQPSNLVNKNPLDALSDAKAQHGIARVSSLFFGALVVIA